MTNAFRTHDGRTLDQAASDLVAREITLCLSSMVSTLANAYGITAVKRRLGASQDDSDGEAIAGLMGQAVELCAPVLDCEEVAREAGMKTEVGEDGKFAVCDAPEGSDMTATRYDSAERAGLAFCDWHGLGPYETEVYEHWAVSTWLAEKLQAAGERVDTDFAGLNVWARTTTGQAISMDGVIQTITREMHTA